MRGTPMPKTIQRKMEENCLHLFGKVTVGGEREIERPEGVGWWLLCPHPRRHMSLFFLHQQTPFFLYIRRYTSAAPLLFFSFFSEGPPAIDSIDSGGTTAAAPYHCQHWSHHRISPLLPLSSHPFFFFCRAPVRLRRIDV